MKCGDIVLNHWAGESNPTRYFIFIKNNGKYSKVVRFDGKHISSGSYYSSDLKTENFEVVGHIPLAETIKTALSERLGGSDA